MSLQIPAEPKTGERLEASWGQKLIKYLRAITPQSSPDIYVSTLSSGTTFFPAKKSRSVSGGTSEPDVCPFDITITEQADPSTDYDLTIRPGTLNGMLPSGILTPVTYTNGSTVYVKVNCLSDGKSVTSCSIEIDATDPIANVAQASSGLTEFDVLIGAVINNTVYKTIGWCGSIQARLEQVFLEDKVSPAVGSSPYTRWYQWLIEAEA